MGGCRVAPSVVEESPGVSMEISVTEGWSDEMPGAVIAHHIGGGLVLEVHPEVGISGPATLAPVGTMVLGGGDEAKSV